MSQESKCAICLEPLLAQPKPPLSSDDNDNDEDKHSSGKRQVEEEPSNHRFGALHPCGHPIHEDCFRAWEASKIADFAELSDSKDSRCQVPCPTCQQPSSSFLRVFLNPAVVQPPPGGRIDDESSGDSSDDDSDDECDCDDVGGSNSGKEEERVGIAGFLMRKRNSAANASLKSSSSTTTLATDMATIGKWKPPKQRPHKKTTSTITKHKLLRQKYNRTKQQLRQCQRHFQSARNQMEVLQEEVSGMELGIMLLKFRHDQLMRQVVVWKRKCRVRQVTSFFKKSGMAAVWFGMGWGMSQLGLIGIKYRS